jgi:hypothetical protein
LQGIGEAVGGHFGTSGQTQIDLLKKGVYVKKTESSSKRKIMHNI